MFMTENNLGSRSESSNSCRVSALHLPSTHIFDVAAVGKIADMYTKLNASRSYVYAVAKACDEGKVSRRVR